jgi:hypothetical protein
MRFRAACVVATLLSLVLSPVPLTVAQTAAETASGLPRLVRFGGIVKDLNGNPLTGVVGITFALYSEQTGGAALWIETQNVTADSNGHYVAVLGSSTPDGLPAEIFTSEQARWVGVQVSGQAEQPRVLLVSAPYALKAGDAETIGGLPPSAFVLANGSGAHKNSTPPANPDVTGKGTLDYIPMWDTTSDIIDSVIFQKSSEIGIATTTPAATLDVNGKTDIRNTLTLYPDSTNNTLAVNGTSFKISSTGEVTFVSGQTYPGAGTITGITTATGSGLSGGGTTGTLSLKVPLAGITDAMLANSKVTLNASAAGGLTVPGAMTLGDTYTIGLKTCSANQVLEYVGTAWTCSSAGTGTITGITTASGSGLAGGGTSGTLSLSVPAAGITNAMLKDSSLTVSAGTDLTGGGSVALGGSTTLNLDTTKVPLLASANTFTANQTVNGNLTVLNNSNYQPFLVQSSSTFGTWLELSNTSAGGQTWNILSAASGNGEGAGNLGITNLLGGTIWLEGPVNAQGNLSVNNKSTVQIGTTTIGGMLNALASSASLAGISANGYTAPSGSGSDGSDGMVSTAGNGDVSNGTFTSGGAGVVATGGYADSFGGAGVMGIGGFAFSPSDFGSNGPGGSFAGNDGSSTCVGDCGSDGVDAQAGTSGESSAGYAGNFTGDLNVSGAITAGTKDFKIDHPLDPANKYLVHASVESSEMMNIYTGNVTTDGQGQATVPLPEWFEALNTDFRYQLTVIGQFAQAIVGRKIENNRFEIRTSAPNVEVSWQVTGVRQDAYAKAHPLVVEQEKDARLRGFYIHPGLYGAPPEKQIEWARHPQMMKKIKEMKAKQLAAAQRPTSSARVILPAMAVKPVVAQETAAPQK